MEKINRLGRIQKYLLLIASSIAFLVILLVVMMMQILKQNSQLIDNFIEKDLQNLAQVIAIDNNVSHISALAIELNRISGFSRFREKITQLNAQIEHLEQSNKQNAHDKIDEAFIHNLLDLSQNILQHGQQIIGYTADIQAIAFEMDNLLSTHKKDLYHSYFLRFYHQILNLSEQNSLQILDSLKKQLRDIPPLASELTKQITPLFQKAITIYEKRAILQEKLIFLSLYLGSQSNEVNKIATQLLDDIRQENQKKAHDIRQNIQQQRQLLIFASFTIIMAILILLYMIVSDMGQKMHHISSALLGLAQGKKSQIHLPVDRKDEIGDLSRSYQIFEKHLIDLALMNEKFFKQNQMMQTILDTMRDGLSVFDTELKLVSWNQKYSEIIGLEEKNLKKGMALSHIEEILQQKRVKNISTRGQNLDFEKITTRRLYQNLSFEKHYPKGQILELRSSPMEGGGFVTLYLDRTSRRSLEQKYQQAQRLEAIGTMTNGIAHDYNNFLAVIYGNVELLLEEEHQNPIFADKLQQIKRICLLAQEQIEQLLSFSRKEVAKTSIFDANQMLTDIYNIMQPLLKEENIELILDLYPQNLWLKANISELESAILNLIGNSQKAIKSQGHIILKTVIQKNKVEISVEDNGVGMDEETVAHIFEPFYSQEVNDIQGTGLGLSMAYGAIKRAKGDISVKAQKGKGCLMKIHLPQHRAEDTTSIAPTSYTATAEPEDMAEKIILIVDDNTDIRRLLSQQLQNLGHMTLEAENGHKAITYLERSHNISLVISDIMMPKVNGIALAQYMYEKQKHVPLILLSAHNPHDCKAYQNLPIKPNFIPKPWKIEDIEYYLNLIFQDEPPTSCTHGEGLSFA